MKSVMYVSSEFLLVKFHFSIQNKQIMQTWNENSCLHTRVLPVCFHLRDRSDLWTGLHLTGGKLVSHLSSSPGPTTIVHTSNERIDYIIWEVRVRTTVTVIHSNTHSDNHYSRVNVCRLHHRWVNSAAEVALNSTVEGFKSQHHALHALPPPPSPNRPYLVLPPPELKSHKLEFQ